MSIEHTDLGLTSTTAESAGGCCGGSCSCGNAVEAKPVPSAAGMVTQSFDLTGLTCNNCVNHVSKAVGAIDGVASVAIDLHANEVSHLTVTSPSLIDPAVITAAVEEAGYHLA